MEYQRDTALTIAYWMRDSDESKRPHTLLGLVLKEQSTASPPEVDRPSGERDYTQ